MNDFLESVHHRMNKSTKNIKILFKQLKRKQRKYNTPTNQLNVLEILKRKKRNIIKDTIRKSKIKSANLPPKLITNNVDVYNKPERCFQ